MRIWEMTSEKRLSKAKAAEWSFADYANKHGYKDKVVGDYAYSKNRHNAQAPIIRLISARGDKIRVYETGKGQYDIPYTHDYIEPTK